MVPELAAFLASLAGCGGPEPAPRSDGVLWLDPTEQAVRISVELRGVRPTRAELEQVDADPDALEALVDAWLDSPEFGTTVRDMHAQQLLLRTDVDEQLPIYGPLSRFDTAAVHEGLVEAPLRIVERVVVEDRPYTEIVTADWLMVSAPYAAAYGLPYDPDGPGWQEGAWDDGRPRAGLLSDNEVWRRHRSAGSNFHRGRANLVASVLLCEDFATRDVRVEGGIDLSDELAVAEAVLQQETCVACHQALDPMAAYFWGFRHQLNAKAVREHYERGCEIEPTDPAPPPGEGVPADLCYPLRLYQPELEDDWASWGLRPPGFYGLPGDTLEDLGRHVAADPRFATCTARRFASWFAQVPAADVDADWALALAERFVASGYSAKALAREVVLDDRFLARAVLPGSAAGFEPVGPLLTRPEHLARTVEALTGFEWQALPDPVPCRGVLTECWGTVDLMRSDRYGFRSMAGGVDGISVLHPTTSPTPVRRLVLERFASEAAGYAVDAEQFEPATARVLFDVVAPEAPLAEDEARAQLASLLARISGQLVGERSAEVDRAWELLDGAYAVSASPQRAWVVTLSALLQDTRMEFH